MYYGTLFQEPAHGTGHASRLDRKFVAELRPFGSSDHGGEELIAEMTAAFLCGRCGIAPATLASQAAYLWGWSHTIRQDKRMIVAAAGAAQRAADWILNEREQVAD